MIIEILNVHNDTPAIPMVEVRNTLVLYGPMRGSSLHRYYVEETQLYIYKSLSNIRRDESIDGLSDSVRHQCSMHHINIYSSKLLTTVLFQQNPSHL